MVRNFLLPRRSLSTAMSEGFQKKLFKPFSQEDDIKKEAESEGTVYLLVAHNGISRIIESYFHDMTNEEFAAFGIKNCELRKYEF